MQCSTSLLDPNAFFIANTANGSDCPWSCNVGYFSNQGGGCQPWTVLRPLTWTTIVNGSSTTDTYYGLCSASHNISGYPAAAAACVVGGDTGACIMAANILTTNTMTVYAFSQPNDCTFLCMPGYYYYAQSCAPCATGTFTASMNRQTACTACVGLSFTMGTAQTACYSSVSNQAGVLGGTANPGFYCIAGFFAAWVQGQAPGSVIPACVQCHGTALTGVQPSTPGLLGLPRDYLNAQLGGWQTGQRKAHAPDCMATIARRLSDADVHAVTSWLASQTVPQNAHPAASKPALAVGATAIDCGSAP